MYDTADGAPTVVEAGEAATALECEDISCADARMAVRSVLTQEYRDLPTDDAERLRDDALLVVTELVTNALLYAGTVTGLSVRRIGDELHLRVSDDSPEAPKERTPVPGSKGGYGWKVIRRLCRRVQIDTEPDGKTVTAVLALA
ncbi:ATP-binding protein [Streptomyces sp. NPDC051684]|uniref:ATP-binding protein n=1 Tax=Streptomyces sp. NPDC051684 TaxID=3365670 RepID=UPI0037A1FB2D